MHTDEAGNVVSRKRDAERDISEKIALGMGVGKIAAQVSHATLGAYRDACTVNPDAVRAWMACGEPIIVLQVENLKELYGLLAAARARGLVAHSASATGTTTVGLIGPGLVAEVDAVCRHLSLL